MPITLAPVNTYKITYANMNNEEIKAGYWTDVDSRWIDFHDGSGQLLRVRSGDVIRIEVVRPTKD